MVGQPEGDLGRAMQADRVQDQVDGLAERGLSVEQVQQFAELARAVLATNDPGHLAIADRERRQQIGRAVAHVLELPASGSAWRDRLARSGRPTHTDAGLLIDAERRAVGWRVQLQVDDLDRLADEVGVALLHPGVKAAPGGYRPPGGSSPPCSCWDAPPPTRGAHPDTAPDPAPTSASGPTSPLPTATGRPTPESGPADLRRTPVAVGDAGGPPSRPAGRRQTGRATAARCAA